jgi:glycosyltransferase involved in cell wall biosynthesis
MEPDRIVSVIIPSKRIDSLKRCLSSLEKQTYPPRLFETIVVSPEKYVEENTFKIAIRNIVNFNANQAEARNIAEKLATGGILAFCDDDCVLPPDWIANAVRNFSDSRVATVGGPGTPPFNSVCLRELLSGLVMVSFLGAGSHKNAYVAGAETKVRNCSPINIVCANMFVDRLKFDEVGGFDPIVPQEEDRLNTKFVKKGYVLVYDPGCSNIHCQRPWGFRFVRNIFWLMKGQGSLTMDRLAPSSKLYLIPPLFAIGLVAAPIFLAFPFFNLAYTLLIAVYLSSLIAETLRLMFKLNLSNLQRTEVFFTFPFALFIHHAVSGFGFIFGFLRRFLDKLRSK